MSTQVPVPYQLYLVISQADCKGRDILAVAEQAILGGVDVIQLREKNSTYDFFLRKAVLLKEVTDHYNIPLIINDNLEVAMQVNAAGIHVGNTDVPPTQIQSLWSDDAKIVGYSIEYLEQLVNVQTQASSYLGVSPVFKTATKSDTVTEWGLEGIAKIRTLTDKPLVAIGQVNHENAKSIIQAGADCIAVVSAICAAENPREAAYELKKNFNHEEI